MDYCKYHPLTGATFHCRDCDTRTCDHCVDDAPEHRGNIHCINCGKMLDSLGSANNVVPFWRRLQEAFKYPLNSSAMGLIIGTAVLSAIASAISIVFIVAVVIYLIATGAMLKYSFSCLEKTADGEMNAPDIPDAYHGGVSLLFQLILMVTIISAAVGATAHYLGYTLGGMLGFLAIVCFPAMLIRFAMTESFIAALNPVAAVSLILTLGLPYGLLMAFIIIMMSSVGVLNELVQMIFPAGTYLMQSIISNYYTVVVFHLMGYILFQYQRELGYIARSSHADEEAERTDVQRLTATLDVYLKEGEYEKVVNLYHQAFKQFPQEKQFFDRYFDLIYLCKKNQLMEDFAPKYLQFVLQQRRYDRLTSLYKQILVLVPHFIPPQPEIRVELARLYKQRNDLKLAIKLLNGLHKTHPEFTGLPDAYLLLSECLELMPGMSAQAQKARQLAEQLKIKLNQLEASRPKTTSSVKTGLTLTPIAEKMPVAEEALAGSRELPPIEFKL
jgi:tetratricopeptide (TPR) repeat protein